MTEVAAIVEGQTEQTFVHDHLALHLGGFGINMWAQLPGRVARRGGVRPWDQVRGDILRTLRGRRGRICTTMFDFYAMPTDWPGRTDAAGMSLEQKSLCVERALLDDLVAKAGHDFRPELFIPYVQVHEFEALLFADVGRMAQTLAPVCDTPQDRLHARFQEIVREAGQAEAINDNYETSPSRRIVGLVPGYRKPLFGPIVAGRIGMDVLRTACPHFGGWLQHLEALADDRGDGSTRDFS
jgi:hypothetical protein